MKIQKLLYPLLLTYPLIKKRRNSLAASVMMSAVVFIMLSVLNPESKYFCIACLAALTTFVGINISEFFRKKGIEISRFNENKWTLLHEMAYIAFLGACISTVTYVAFKVTGWYDLPLGVVFWIAFRMSLVIVILLSIGVYLTETYRQSEEKTTYLPKKATINPILMPLANTHNAHFAQSEFEIFRFEGEKKGEVFCCPINDLLCVVSDKNYLHFHYLKEGGCKEQMIRGKLSRVQDSLSDTPQYVHCHKKFIVNVRNIEKIEGNNSRGKKLTFKGAEGIEAQVARSFMADFNACLEREALCFS